MPAAGIVVWRANGGRRYPQASFAGGDVIEWSAQSSPTNRANIGRIGRAFPIQWKVSTPVSGDQTGTGTLVASHAVSGSAYPSSSQFANIRRLGKAFPIQWKVGSLPEGEKAGAGSVTAARTLAGSGVLDHYALGESDDLLQTTVLDGQSTTEKTGGGGGTAAHGVVGAGVLGRVGTGTLASARTIIASAHTETASNKTGGGGVQALHTLAGAGIRSRAGTGALARGASLDGVAISGGKSGQGDLVLATAIAGSGYRRRYGTGAVVALHRVRTPSGGGAGTISPSSKRRIMGRTPMESNR